MNKDKYFDSDYELIEKEKLKPVYLNIEELKQTFQQMIGEIKTENAKQNSALKEIIEQKDEKIISLVKQMKESELNMELEQTNNLDYKSLCFVHVANKWKEFDLSNCCINKCINTENPIGKCIKGNGFANIINDANIEYIEWFKKKGCFGGYDKYSYIFAENSFNKPKEDFNNYSLFYYEIKSKTDEEDKNRRIEIGLKNSKDNYVKLTIGVNYSSINYKIEKKKNSSNSIGNIPLNNNLSMDWRLIEKNKINVINLENIKWNNNDIFGCGLIYPPTNDKMSKELPCIFFTQNGQQIGKQFLLNDNFDNYKPYISLVCCSLETNFGNDLEAKPFVYDIIKHKQYSDFEKDVNELIEMFPLIKKEGIKKILLANGGIKENVLEKLNYIF